MKDVQNLFCGIWTYVENTNREAVQGGKEKLTFGWVDKSVSLPWALKLVSTFLLLLEKKITSIPSSQG